MWAWGYNTVGQLGAEIDSIDEMYPVQAKIRNVKQIAAGMNHTIFLKEDGTVWACGSNAYGQLGNGTRDDKKNIIQVEGLTNVKQVAAGSTHTVALKEDGTVWTWGGNQYGQLGNGASGNGVRETTPIQAQITNVKQIAAGYEHTVFLKEDGTVWTCGYNSSGQLGDGTKDKRTTPVQVHGLTGVKQIAVGFSQTFAVKEDGTLWAWGQNQWGQLGDGTTIHSSIPVKVQGIINVKQVDGGYQHTVALKEDGTVWAWGNCSYGQLGEGTVDSNISKTTPVKLSSISNVQQVVAGEIHTLAVKKDGTVWGWGSNYSNTLGLGYADRVQPIPVHIELN